MPLRGSPKRGAFSLLTSHRGRYKAGRAAWVRLRDSLSHVFLWEAKAGRHRPAHYHEPSWKADKEPSGGEEPPCRTGTKERLELAMEELGKRAGLSVVRAKRRKDEEKVVFERRASKASQSETENVVTGVSRNASRSCLEEPISDVMLCQNQRWCLIFWTTSR